MERQDSFGSWLRRKRKALDLTQAALANKVGCSEAAIRKIEAEERRPSTQVVELLADIFSIPPNERSSFLRFARGDWKSAPNTISNDAPWHVESTAQPRTTAKHNLPAQMTRFIGREVEITELLLRLKKTGARLHTLTGAGGIGKTRLALQVAASLLDVFPDGVWLVELAPLADPVLVPQTIIAALGLVEQPGRSPLALLTDYLHEKHLLLVLDNCEHLVEACAELADGLLRSAPHLTILATSREPLDVAGETIFRVPSLSFPERGQAVILKTLDRYAAVRLFVDRAGQMNPGYEVTVQNAGAVASICQHLDGIPLAIELAAARMNVLTAEELAGRLDNAFHLLTGGRRSVLPRQQTLRATIDWSYNLLSERESLLLRRLAVFAGEWDLAAAEGVCAGGGLEPPEILDLLANLVNKSMVVASAAGSGVTRYRMLETIHQYAREKLAQEDLSNNREEVAILRRHLTYYMELAESIEPQWRGPKQKEWRRRLMEDIENIRLALGTGLREDPQTGLRLASALWRFWNYATFMATEGVRWLRNCLDHPGNAAHTPQRGYALLRLSNMLAVAEIPGGEAVSQESLEIFRELDNRLGQGMAHLSWGFACFFHDNFSSGREHCAAAYEILMEVGDPWWRAEAQIAFAWLAEYEGDITTTLAYDEKALALYREIGDLEKIARVYQVIGSITALYLGNLHGGYAMLLESQAIFGQIDLDFPMAYVLQDLSEILCWQGDFVRASAAWEEMGYRARLSGNDATVPAFDLHYGRLICLQGRLAEGIAIVEQTVNKLQESAAIHHVLATSQTVLMELAYAHACLGDIERAENLNHAFDHLFKDAHYHQPRLKRLLGFLAYRKGKVQESAGYYQESLRHAVQMKWRLEALLSIEGFAWAQHLKGKPVEAARLLGTAGAFRSQIGALVFPRDRPFYDQAISRLKEQLGEAGFAAAWSEGQAIDFDLACSRACVQTEILNDSIR